MQTKTKLERSSATLFSSHSIILSEFMEEVTGVCTVKPFYGLNSVSTLIAIVSHYSLVVLGEVLGLP